MQPDHPNWQEIDASTLPNAFYAHSDALQERKINMRKLNFWLAVRRVLVALVFLAAVYELGRW